MIPPGRGVFQEPIMSDWQWFYAPGNVQQGPVSTAELQRMLASGQLPPVTPVWREGMGTWLPATNVEGLLPQMAPPPPSAPPGYGQGYPQYPQGYPQQAAPLGYMSPQQPASAGDDAGLRWLVPVGRSIWAIAAGYLGLFSFIIFPAPLALIVSVVAVARLKRNPQLHGWGRAIFGLIMGILGTIVLGIMLISMAATTR
jgi:hypothetical protein